jgi:hypothetical protein
VSQRLENRVAVVPAVGVDRDLELELVARPVVVVVDDLEVLEADRRLPGEVRAAESRLGRDVAERLDDEIDRRVVGPQAGVVRRDQVVVAAGQERRLGRHDTVEAV